MAYTLWGHKRGVLKVSEGAIKSIFKKSGLESFYREATELYKIVEKLKKILYSNRIFSKVLNKKYELQVEFLSSINLTLLNS